MNDLMNLTPDDISQGIKIGKSALDALPGVKQVIADSVGTLIGDPVSGARRKRNIRRQLEMAALEIELQEKKIELNKLTYADASRVFEASADEDRDKLQSLWATIIAKMMTGELATVRAEWLELVRKFEPLDALVLLNMDKFEVAGPDRDWQISAIYSQLQRYPGTEKISPVEVDLTLLHLEKLELLVFAERTIVLGDGGRVDSLGFYLTSLGRHILDLVSEDK